VYYPFELYGDQIGAKSELVALAERIVLRFCADAVITQNQHRAGVYVNERWCRRTPVIVHNYKPRRPPPTSARLREALGLSAEQRIVLYEGILVDGRWLPELAEASRSLPGDVVIVLMGKDTARWTERHRERLLPLIEQGRVILAPPQPHDQLLDFVADADVGVIIYDDSTRNNVFCEPGKLGDYVLSGVPVVAPKFPTLEPVVLEFGIGECFVDGTPEAIGRAIMAVLSRGKAFWSENLSAASETLVWETQEPAFLDAIGGRAP
jgi:glycosyltransferase involved in cell wall biosynthesis